MKKQLFAAAVLTTLTAASANFAQAEDFTTQGVVAQKGIMLDEAPEMNSGFGPNGVWTSIGAPEFMPRAGTVAPWHLGNGYVYPDSSNDIGIYWAQLNLPNGAQINSIYMPVYDNDSGSNITISLRGVQAWSPAIPPYIPGDSTPELKLFGDASSGTSETPGYVNLSITPSDPLVIHEYSDFDGDGKGNSYFFIEVLTNRGSSAANSAIQFFGAAVKWTRTIAPAPASASFDDVPTDYWAFREIEALAKSGITTGCDTSNFCPDDNVTRAQMAAFLARALGLHWGT